MWIQMEAIEKLLYFILFILCDHSNESLELACSLAVFYGVQDCSNF